MSVCLECVEYWLANLRTTLLRIENIVYSEISLSRPVSKNIARAPSLRAPYDGFMEPLSLALKCRVRGAGLYYITKSSK